jgi:4-amino-4-deoxy-L-arabinose transferase-like glycosyltransferase
VGFPDIFFDEGVYMSRAMHVLNGLGPQETLFHDHPFFGQIFLAGTLAVTGYPNSLNPVADANSIATLYLVPRIIMGILAVIDTLLIYKIAEKRYDTNVAFVASLLFAVMPMTWILRRILLDSILLPFLLSSILLALYTKESKRKKTLVLFSGIFLALAIFTKIPAITMIPLIVYLIHSNIKNTKILGLWFVPVILIPLIWPVQSIITGQFHLWVRDVFWQAHRQGFGLPYISGTFIYFDPVLFVLGLSGFIFAFIKKDYFILLWLIPFLIFFSIIGYAQYFYWIPMLPVFCIAAAILIVDLLKKIKIKKLQQILPFVIFSGIGIFGLVNTTLLITTDVTNSQFQVAEFVAKYVKNNNNITILASPVYSWVLSDIFGNKTPFLDYSGILFAPIPTQKILLVADQHFMIDITRGKQLQDVYNNTSTIATFVGKVSKYDLSKYPYHNLAANYEGDHIEIRTNG